MVQYNALYEGSYDSQKAHLSDVAGAESNVAVNLSKLKPKNLDIYWVSLLGKDEPGELIRQELMNQINVEAPMIPEEKTGISFLNHYTNGDHIKTYERTGSAASKLNFDFLEATITDANIVHMTGITPALSESCHNTTFAALEKCKSQGSLISLDVNYREQLWDPQIARHTLDKMIPYSTIFKVGLDEAEMIWNENLSGEDYAEKFHQGQGTISVVTLGSEGAVLFNGISMIKQPGLKVEVVDPIGAGDAFVAGLIRGLLTDMNEFISKELIGSLNDKNLNYCLRMANICGSMTCTRKGDTAAMPTMNEIDQYL